MNEERIPPLQADTQKQDKWYAPLTKCTPLSKYFAMVVVIVLPFIGFLLGVEYAEQDGSAQLTQNQTNVLASNSTLTTKSIKSSAQPDTNVQNINAAHSPDQATSTKVYRNEKYGFEFSYPANYVYESFDTDKPTDYSHVPEELLATETYLEPVAQLFYLSIFTSSSTLREGVHGGSPAIRIIVYRNEDSWTIPQYSDYLNAGAKNPEFHGGIEGLWLDKSEKMLSFKGKETYVTHTGCCGASFRTMLLLHKGRILQLSGPNENVFTSDSSEKSTAYQSILESVRFL
jgi:hypothetical protein